MVTPAISGLFNGEALKALWDVGIRYVDGDNTVDALIPPNLWYGIITTQDVHGFPGMFITPR